MVEARNHTFMRTGSVVTLVARLVAVSRRAAPSCAADDGAERVAERIAAASGPPPRNRSALCAAGIAGDEAGERDRVEPRSIATEIISLNVDAADLTREAHMTAAPGVVQVSAGRATSLAFRR
jgi:hypothetical protein